jgi:4-amino-4-deoxy-L-arabinose transferase-like glycosyltransferase
MRTALAVTIVAGIVRLIIAALTPLFPDETYYWEWSRRLAAGYFDHPPMIAWLIRAGTTLAGDTPLGVRLFPGMAGIVAALFVVAAAKRLAGDRAALLAAIVFAVMPLSAAGLVLATPDAPLLAAAAATCYAVLRALEPELSESASSKSAFTWWCIAGVALGVALTSKYTAVLVPLGVFVALLVRRDLRPRLREPGPYVATAIALVIFSPVVVWNATHDWVSFAFQLQHGLGGVSGSAFRRELDLIGGQLALVSPILFVMMTLAIFRPSRLPPLSALLPPIAITIFAFFMYSATRRRVEANWPALAYIPGILLLAARAPTIAWDRWMRAGIGLAAVLTLVTYVNTFTPILPVPARRDPVARAAGWDDLARAVNRVYAPRLPISSYRTHVAADRYQDASELAFHLPNHPEVYALNLTTRPNQYDLWLSFPERAYARDGLIVALDDVAGEHPTLALLAPHFERITRGDQIMLARNGDPVRYLRIWVLDRWLGTWPESASGSTQD